MLPSLLKQQNVFFLQKSKLSHRAEDYIETSARTKYLPIKLNSLFYFYILHRLMPRKQTNRHERERISQQKNHSHELNWRNFVEIKFVSSGSSDTVSQEL